MREKTTDPLLFTNIFERSVLRCLKKVHCIDFYVQNFYTVQFFHPSCIHRHINVSSVLGSTSKFRHTFRPNFRWTHCKRQTCLHCHVLHMLRKYLNAFFSYLKVVISYKSIQKLEQIIQNTKSVTKKFKIQNTKKQQHCSTFFLKKLTSCQIYRHVEQCLFYYKKVQRSLYICVRRCDFYVPYHYNQMYCTNTRSHSHLRKHTYIYGI